MNVEEVEPPADGLWRVARSPKLLEPSPPLEPELLSRPDVGNRFDSPVGTYGVTYLATQPEACYGETLSRLRPDPSLLDLNEDGFMNPGEVPQDWRTQRSIARAAIAEGATSNKFVDIESLKTRTALEPLVRPLLVAYGIKELDVSVVRGADRRVTRLLAQIVHAVTTDEGTPMYAGIRYLSRLSSDWELWAVFDRVPLELVESRPVLRTDNALRSVAKMYDLTVF